MIEEGKKERKEGEGKGRRTRRFAGSEGGNGVP
jgi:hypothetical protein